MKQCLDSGQIIDCVRGAANNRGNEIIPGWGLVPPPRCHRRPTASLLRVPLFRALLDLRGHCQRDSPLTTDIALVLRHRGSRETPLGFQNNLRLQQPS